MFERFWSLLIRLRLRVPNLTATESLEMCLPLIDVFEQPCKVWKERHLSPDEAMERFRTTGEPVFTEQESLEATVANHLDAAQYVLTHGTARVLEHHIDSYLRASSGFKEVLDLMPADVPESLNAYKSMYPACDLESVSNDIVRIGGTLHEGQILFHGGLCVCEPGEEFILDRPLSTSFCPKIALNNAHWRGKAYKAGVVHLFVLKVASPSVKAFVFPLGNDSADSNLNHEKEVLICSGRSIKVTRKTLINDEHPAYLVDSSLQEQKKLVPAFVVEATVT